MRSPDGTAEDNSQITDTLDVKEFRPKAVDSVSASGHGPIDADDFPYIQENPTHFHSSEGGSVSFDVSDDVVNLCGGQNSLALMLPPSECFQVLKELPNNFSILNHIGEPLLEEHNEKDFLRRSENSICDIMTNSSQSFAVTNRSTSAMYDPNCVLSDCTTLMEQSLAHGHEHFQNTTVDAFPQEVSSLLKDDAAHQNLFLRRRQYPKKPQLSLKKTKQKIQMSHEDVVSSLQGLLDKKSTFEKGTKCGCKSTECLKGYCDCYNEKGFCSDSCRCQNCCNNAAHISVLINLLQTGDQRSDEVKVAAKKARALLKKHDLLTPLSKPKEYKKCKCEKSNCTRNYCECFKAGQGCTEICGCISCENTTQQRFSTWNQTPSVEESFFRTVVPESRILSGKLALADNGKYYLLEIAPQPQNSYVSASESLPEEHLRVFEGAVPVCSVGGMTWEGFQSLQQIPLPSKENDSSLEMQKQMEEIGTWIEDNSTQKSDLIDSGGIVQELGRVDLEEVKDKRPQALMDLTNFMKNSSSPITSLQDGRKRKVTTEVDSKYSFRVKEEPEEQVTSKTMQK